MDGDLSPIGIVGLGAVGRRLSGRLLAAGATVHVHDLDADAQSAAVAAGGTAAESCTALAHACPCIVLSLPTPEAARAVMLGDSGVLAGAASGTLVVDTSTLDPDTSRELAAAAAEKGIGYLDTPVTCAVTAGGGVAAAASGELTFLVGGRVEDVARAGPLFEILGRRVHHLGGPGAGSAMKLVSNHVSGIATLALAEGLALAGASGFPARRTLEVLRDTVADSYVLREVVDARLDAVAGPASFPVRLMRKDHDLAAALGAALGVPLPLNDAVREVCAAMIADGYADRDNVSAVEWFAKRTSGVSDR